MVARNVDWQQVYKRKDVGVDPTTPIHSQKLLRGMGLLVSICLSAKL